MAGDEVLVAGAGPVGLVTALALARRGREVRVFEARPRLADDLRATTIQPRALEIFDSLGVLPQLVEAGRTVRTLQYFEDDTCVVSLSYASIAPYTSCPFRLHLDQRELCQIVADALPAGTIRWGERVVGFTEEDGGVVVELEGGRTERGSFLVGADGLNSAVRKGLAIEHDTGERATFFTCQADRGFRSFLPESFESCAYLFRGSHWALAMEMRDAIRLLFPMPPGVDPREAMRSPYIDRWSEAVFGRVLPLDVLHDRGTYTVQQRLVRSFGWGRVYLAGDSAHAAFPVGGMAMNVGIIDGYVLAHAIARGAEGALRLYDERRRAQIREGVLARTASARRTLSAPGPIGRWSRKQALRRLGADPKRAREHLLALSLLA